MMTSQEQMLRSLAAYQECQSEVRSRHAARSIPATGPYWSPAVAVGFLGAVLLAGISLVVIILSSIL